MNRIIVTIRINQKKEYDLELPVHQKIKDLMQDISDSLEGLDWIHCPGLTRKRSALWTKEQVED